MPGEPPTDASRIAEVHRMATLGRMLAAVVHELNTPIGSLRSNRDVTLRSAQALKKLLAEGDADAGPGARKAADLLDGIAAMAATDKIACERMAAVVSGLRAFSREEPREFRAVQVHDVIEDALRLVEWMYRGRVMVQKDFGSLPPIECIPQALGQVLLNLLVNAGQAIEGQGTVTIRTLLEGPLAHISVSDTGKGIRPEDRPRIFSRGFTTKEAGEGTGLGLSIARDIVVEGHGGSIDFESEPGAGAVFHVRIPVTQTKKHAH